MFAHFLYFFLLVFSFEAFAQDILPGNPVEQENSLSCTLASSTGKVIIHKIILQGNKITRPQIIFRELVFHENDTISTGQLFPLIDQSKKNLLNTSLFNFVTIDTLSSVPGSIDITIELIERWYIWPMPFFQLSDRNFNVWWETKDLSKADYGINFTWDNFRGRKESVVLLLKMGYDETFGLAYKIPYINKRKTIGIGLNGGFSGNHEVPYITQDNVQVFHKEKDKYVQNNIFSTFSLSFRKNIYNSHIFQLNYNDYNFADTILKLNPAFSRQKHLQFFSFYYVFKNDHRDIKAYPLTGYYYDLELAKHGFGILQRENINMAYVHASARKFWQLHNRWYVAAGISSKLSTNSFQPYFLERGLGYGNDFVRSYEYNVADGQNFILFKSNLKFELLPTRVKEFKFIPTKKFGIMHYAFYLNLLADAGYVHDRQVSGLNNNLSDALLLGTGIGLDFVTYYDKVMRIEYSLNKLGKGRIFLHFVSPI